MSEKQDKRSYLEQTVDESVKSFFGEVCEFIFIDLGLLAWVVLPIAPVASLAGIFLLADYSATSFYAYLVGAGLFVIAIVFGVVGLVYSLIEKAKGKPISSKIMIVSGFCYVGSSIVGVFIIIQLFRAISDFLSPITGGV